MFSVRREGYFRALLVQSRGEVMPGCDQRCGCSGGSLPFLECVRVPDFQDGACGSCVWQSRGLRCDHPLGGGRSRRGHDDDNNGDDDDGDRRRAVGHRGAAGTSSALAILVE